MNLSAVKSLVRQGEGMHIEFKLKTAHPDKIVRELVAFANSSGGTLLVGVSDEGQLKGVRHVDEDEYLLVRAIEKHCYPPLPHQLYRVPLSDERHVLAVYVPPSLQKPHYVRLDAEPAGKAYVRVADKSIQASKEVREVLKGEQKQREVRFQYGDKEGLLMRHLGRHPRVTVQQFAEIAGIPRHVASRTLVLLVLAGVLLLHPHDAEDFFTLRAA